MEISNWEKTKREYERLKKEGRLSEIEPLPAELEESVAKAARNLFKISVNRPAVKNQTT